MTKAHRNDDFIHGTEGLKSVPSKIGQLIGHDLSPAIFNSQEMKAADLAYYVGDVRTILKVAPQLEKMMEYLPKGRILFFHCRKGALTAEKICDFFNKVCTLVPFQLNPSDLTEIGSVEHSQGSGDGVMHTYWGYPLDQIEPTDKKDDGKKEEKKDGETNDDSKKNDSDSKGNEETKKDIPSAFEKILKGDEELKQADASVKVQKKADLEKYFRRDKTGINKLDDSSDYLVIYIHGDEMDEDGAAKLANDINDGAGKAVGGKTFSSSDVIKLGTIRKKFPASGNFENYDMFAVKVG